MLLEPAPPTGFGLHLGYRCSYVHVGNSLRAFAGERLDLLLLCEGQKWHRNMERGWSFQWTAGRDPCFQDIRCGGDAYRQRFPALDENVTATSTGEVFIVEPDRSSALKLTMYPYNPPDSGCRAVVAGT